MTDVVKLSKKVAGITAVHAEKLFIFPQVQVITSNMFNLFDHC